jgi:hypothetical protein
VLTKSCKSYATDRRRTYCKSIRIHCSKDTVLRPQHCQMQVMPGDTDNLWRCHGSHWSDSKVGKGRGPTNDISPRNTFHN